MYLVQDNTDMGNNDVSKLYRRNVGSWARFSRTPDLVQQTTSPTALRNDYYS